MAESAPGPRSGPVFALCLDDDGSISVITRAEFERNGLPVHYGMELSEHVDGDRTFAQTVIRSLYNDGYEMFSKYIFRDVAEQFDRCAENPSAEQRISLVGIDGNVVDFFFRLGVDVTEGGKVRWRGCKIVTSKPRLDYRGIYRLMSAAGHPDVNPQGAYLTIGIVLETEVRDATTDTVVSPWLDRSCDTVLERFYRDRQS